MKGKIPESILKRPKQPYRAPISSVFLGKNHLNMLEKCFLKDILINPESLIMNQYPPYLKKLKERYSF